VNDHERRRRLARLVAGLRAEIVLVLGPTSRPEVEQLNVVQLLATRDRVCGPVREGEAA
jgi:hypothetical protein